MTQDSFRLDVAMISNMEQFALMEVNSRLNGRRILGDLASTPSSVTYSHELEHVIPSLGLNFLKMGGKNIEY